jgi:hypothetical protein
MKKVLFSLMAMLLLSMSGIAQTTYTMVNSASQLEAGAQYVLVGYDNDGQAFIMSYQKSNNRHAIAIDEIGGVITATVATDPSQQDAPYEFTLGGSAGSWTIFDPLNNGYLYAAGGGNYLRTQTDLTDNGRWTITDGDEGGMVPVSNGGVEQCYLRYNITSTLFGCYKESSNVAAPVYFFKAGGAPAPPVPPCAYPTNFRVSEVDGIDVTLSWTDAPCDVWYLVLASTGAIPVPTDGVPVSNGLLAKNVGPGNQTVTFSGLEGNTTYNFAIFPYTGSGANILYLTDEPYPTATATTEDITYLLNEDFESGDLGCFTAYDMYGDQSWHVASYNGNQYAYMNGYFQGSSYDNEDWLISCRLSGMYRTITLQFMNAMNYTGFPLELMISTDYDGVSEPSEFEWELITDMFDWSTGGYAWTYSGERDITNYTGEYFYFAFVYKSTSTEAAAWEIDDVKVIAKEPLSVTENTNAQLVLSPNPAREQVVCTLESDAQVSVFDMMGRKLSEMHAAAGEAQLNVSQLENGVYFVNVRYANGSTAVSKFVKF